jgi:hypothetical protein
MDVLCLNTLMRLPDYWESRDSRSQNFVLFFLSLTASNPSIYRLPAPVSHWHLSCYPDGTSVSSALSQVATPAVLYRLLEQKKKTSRDQMRMDIFSNIIPSDKYVGNVQPCTPLLPAGQLSLVSYLATRRGVYRNIYFCVCTVTPRMTEGFLCMRCKYTSKGRDIP